MVVLPGDAAAIAGGVWDGLQHAAELAGVLSAVQAGAGSGTRTDLLALPAFAVLRFDDDAVRMLVRGAVTVRREQGDAVQAPVGDDDVVSGADALTWTERRLPRGGRFTIEPFEGADGSVGNGESGTEVSSAAERSNDALQSAGVARATSEAEWHLLVDGAALAGAVRVNDVTHAPGHTDRAEPEQAAASETDRPVVAEPQTNAGRATVTDPAQAGVTEPDRPVVAEPEADARRAAVTDLEQVVAPEPEQASWSGELVSGETIMAPPTGEQPQVSAARSATGAEPTPEGELHPATAPTPTSADEPASESTRTPEPGPTTQPSPTTQPTPASASEPQPEPDSDPPADRPSAADTADTRDGDGTPAADAVTPVAVPRPRSLIDAVPWRLDENRFAATPSSASPGTANPGPTSSASTAPSAGTAPSAAGTADSAGVAPSASSASAPTPEPRRAPFPRSATAAASTATPTTAASASAAASSAASSASPAPAASAASAEDHDGLTLTGAEQQALRTASRRPPGGPRAIFATGDVIPLDGITVLGRRPALPAGADPAGVRLVTVPSPQSDVSRSHLRIERLADGWHATDLHSTNGTVLTHPGEPARRLQDGASLPLRSGDGIDLGDGVTAVLEDLA
ncbi:FHA domain-containing protein [Tersicoccus sp. Bi-70]|uniref:FHA domain-containing protein n=1 Tax=Tersicoccus sp. Bi-70 TaxID=1897634 RepID=UPI000977A6E1|nr:FHA domain-containing protein [Tersicoccus sp. Bi-70]OMH31316.1 hypothetical protein BGP79_09835 [Tersicoccus sp. Bi-70]